MYNLAKHNFPKVSVLIPVYNREKIILETLNSAVNQTYKNIEIIVVDNKSTDNTYEIIKEFARTHPNVKVYQNEENIGPVRNWQRCLEYATGEYGKFLWSDDLIAPDFVERTLPFLVNDDEIGFVFTATELFYEATGDKLLAYSIGPTGIYDTNMFIENALFEGTVPVSPGCALFRMKDLRKNLLIHIPNKIGSDFSMHAIGNDLLIYLLTAHQYKKFAFVNEKLSFFRAHKGSISVYSEDGKLPLHYNITKAFFVENYRVDLIKKLNAVILLNIKRFSKSSEKYRLDKIENYYLKNTKYSIDYGFLIKKIRRKILRKAISYLKNKINMKTYQMQ